MHVLAAHCWLALDILTSSRSGCTFSNNSNLLRRRRWLVAVFTVTKQDILIAAGVDAVIMLKTIELGVQMFAPIACVGLVICAPPYHSLL